MACNIKAFIEYKNNNPYDWWENFGGTTLLIKNYHMFSILSKSVRFECDGALEAKGLPINLSKYTKETLKNTYHSHTWLTVEELTTAIETYNIRRDLLSWPIHEYESLLASMVKLSENYTVRVIICFEGR